MATEIPAAEISPRNENGVIKFYEGDTFTFSIACDMTDQDGEPITANNATDTITVIFYNHKNVLLKTFCFGYNNGETPDGTIDTEDNSIEMTFDATTTALFPKGVYHYDVIFKNSERRITIADKAPFISE